MVTEQVDQLCARIAIGYRMDTRWRYDQRRKYLVVFGYALTALDILADPTEGMGGLSVGRSTGDGRVSTTTVGRRRLMPCAVAAFAGWHTRWPGRAAGAAGA
jgi:hypothetical protein